MTVITISRQYGSLGDEIVEQVAEILGYRLFDKNMIAQAAKAEGISDKAEVDFSEDSYMMRSFLDRLFGRQQPKMGSLRVWTEDNHGVRQMEEMHLTEEDAISLVQKAIRSACETGSVIVVGRGGQAFLQDFANALHVRIQSSMDRRIQRVLAKENVSLAAAKEMIDAHDKASAYYVKHVYNVNVDDPSLYHLMLNTGKMGITAAASLIVDAARLLPSMKAGA